MGINSINIQQSQATGFELNKGINSLNIGISLNTNLELQRGINGINTQNANISLWYLKNEFGEDSTLNGTITVTSLSNPLDTYTVNITNGSFVLYPFTDNTSPYNIIPQSILFESDSTNESGYIELTPTPNIYYLQLYFDDTRQNVNQISFGMWNRALTLAELSHLHNNGHTNNPWTYLPVEPIQRLNQKELKVWHQFQDSSFYDSGGLKIINWANNGITDGTVSGYASLTELLENIYAINILL